MLGKAKTAGVQTSDKSADNLHTVPQARTEIESGELKAESAEARRQHISVASEGVSTSASERHVAAWCLAVQEMVLVYPDFD
jgi:hypothetical protein